jgi:hypothetical protein
MSTVWFTVVTVTFLLIGSVFGAIIALIARRRKQYWMAGTAVFLVFAFFCLSVGHFMDVYTAGLWLIFLLFVLLVVAITTA